MMEIKLTSGKTLPCKEGESIYHALKNNGIYLIASCGGKGVCGKCRVKVLEGRSRKGSTSHLTKKDIEDKFSLACQAFPESNVLVEIPDSSRLVIGDKIAVSKTKNLLELLASEGGISPPVKIINLVMDPPLIQDIGDLERLRRALMEKGIPEMRFSHGFVSTMAAVLRHGAWKVNLAYAEHNEAIYLSAEEDRTRYGIAVDIGTTTVVLYLVDYSDGSLVDSGMTYNSQIRYGDDVITRIVQATEGGGLEDLRRAVVNDINDLLEPIRERHGIRKEDIDAAVISGNTTMAQLFWGLDPSSIREEPYVPTVNFFPTWKAGTARIRINPQAPVHTFPCVGSYVGGDIVSGVLASRMHTRHEVALFMDIGTNGEIVIGNNDWLITAACSAGPCFEGGGIRYGMRATEGAIESVKIDPSSHEVSLGVIGSTIPSGICGSGMIDAICELFFAGFIDQRGKFMRDLESARLRIEDEGPEFVLFKGEFRDIVLAEADIDNIIRAKAAIYAGVALLLREVGLSLDIVERVYIAGGFGNYLNVEKAIMIGMLPDLPREKFTFLGNTSVSGAYLCLLSEKMRRDAEEIARKMTYIELSVSRGFMDEYMSALFLPHTNMDLFPSVKDFYERNKQ